MPESRSHREAKRKAPGQTEVKTRGGRLDAASENTATEIERSGSLSRLEHAARKLKNSGKPRNVLVVPNTDIDKATEAMRNVGTSGTVKNLGGTRRRSVRRRK